jgi:hypothetical protein
VKSTTTKHFCMLTFDDDSSLQELSTRLFLPILTSDSGLGGGRGEEIRNIYYSNRQLPPGHDPGADSSDAPTAGSVAHGH